MIHVGHRHRHGRTWSRAIGKLLTGSAAALPVDRNDVADFVGYCREQGVGPFVYGALSRSRHSAITAALEPEYAASLSQHLKQQSLLRLLAREATRQGLTAWVLKGPALAQLYGDPAQRPMNDLDLWIKLEEKTLWHRLLLDQRFTQPAPSDVFISQRGQVDLHTSLVDAPRMPER